MKHLSVRVLGGASVLSLFLPLGPTTDSRAWANPFQMRVLDQRTAEGLSRVRLTSDNGIVCFTRTDGTVLWTESSLMDRDVSFRIETSDTERTVSVRVTPGGRADVFLAR